ncbi:MAG: B12-binding domain-containing radical SAM protein [Paraclostridium sp.]
MKFALIQLIPKDLRNANSINLGMELVKDIIEKEGWKVDVYRFGDKIRNIKSYDIIGFSIFYYTQMLNLVPFLREQGIEIDREKRNQKPFIMVGGQGIDNPKPISKFIDVACMGNGEGIVEYVLSNYKDLDKLCECDSLYVPRHKEEFKYYHTKEVVSKPIIKGSNSMIELNRGCRSRCKFCQYGYTNGKYREKDISLVKEQVLYVLEQGIRNINFLSCNLGGYSKINELLDFCIEHNVRVLNCDIRIDEYTEEVAKKFDKLKIRSLRVGVESFDAKTRALINKGVSKSHLDEFIDRALRYNISNLHFYLIYGLPVEEDYNEWFRYMEILNEKRSAYERAIRLEFSITNFEPSLNTPYEKSPFIDFDKKHEFMRQLLTKQYECGVNSVKGETLDYRNLRGRTGRKERSYNIGMWLVHGDETVGLALEKLKTRSVRSSIAYMYDKIKKVCDEDTRIYPIMELKEKENIWD